MSHSPSIVRQIVDGIKSHPQRHLVPLLFVGPLLDSGLFYIQTQISFRRSDLISTNNKEQYLKNYYTLFGIAIVQISINLLFNNWFKKAIVKELQQHYQNFYVKSIFGKANPYWLSNQDTLEIFNSFEKGSETIVDILLFIVDALKSIFSILLSLTLIWKELGIKNIWSIIIVIGIVYLRYKIEQINKNNHNQLRKKNKKYSNQNNLLSKNMFVNFLNGKTQNIFEYISENQILITESKNKVTYQNLILRDILYIFEKLIRLANVIYLSSSFNCSQLFTFEMIFSRIQNNISRPIGLYRELCQKSLDWFELQEKLEEIVLEDIDESDKKIMRDFDINTLSGITISSNLNIPKSQEYRVIGPSGSGKSTWIKSSLCHLKDTYQVNWFYLDQKMEISQSKYMTIYEYFEMYLINKNISELREKIISYSVLLGLEKVINANKIDKPFQDPSGGETKRICILRKFIPILLKDICPKVIFTDEINTGLDEQNFLKVRQLIEHIKNEFKIVFITVEHREYQSKTQVINLEVSLDSNIDSNYKFEHSKSDQSYLDKLFSSFNNKPDKEETPEMTFPPKFSIQSFKIIRPRNNCGCFIM